MKIWVDDIRPAPEGYVWCKSVNETILYIISVEEDQKRSYNLAYHWLKHHDLDGYYKALTICKRREIELIDLDHDAGEYAVDGGDYIGILNWLEETGRNYPIRIHSMNPVGRGNMRQIIRKNGWTEID
jgi:hypothetical protein